MSTPLIALDRDLWLSNDVWYKWIRGNDWPLDSCEVWRFLISKPLSLDFDTLNKMAAIEPFGFNHA